MTTRGVSQGGEPIAVKPPFLTKRRAIIIISLMVFLAFFGLPLWNILGRMADSPKQLLQQIIVGLTKGTYLAIIALGYTLVYGIIELINFAHAEVYMIGAFASLSLLSIFGLNDPANKPSGLQIALLLPIILILVMTFTALLNVSIELLAYRRLRNAPRLAPLISAIGVSFILQNVGILWGDRRLWNGIGLTKVGQAMGSSAVGPKSFPPLLPSGQVFFIPTSWFVLAYKDLLVILISLSLLAALYLFVRYTKLGKAMRATAQDRDAARLMGINANRTISLTFLIGGALAGAAGMLVGLYNGTAVFNMGFTAGLLSFTAAVLGGIGNILGSALGGLLIGLFLALSDQYINARWSNAVIFGILVLILVFRPTGLLGEEGGQKA
jgi:branched-chain amino acid transport system permease protein